MMRIVVAHTGASGSIYCLKFLKWLSLKRDVKVSFIASAEGYKVLQHEAQYTKNDIKKLVPTIISNNDLFADISSGTAGVNAMVIVPASMNTIAKIVHGVSDTLITRCASNMLKLRRKLIVVAREMPLSTIHLENLTALSKAGADIMLAAPPFYNLPKNIDELTLPVLYYINELLGLENNINFKWRGESIASAKDDED
ncbi:MAG: UbiX family flavin prenyltransferase [Candidatus Wallbacteria bacterium]